MKIEVKQAPNGTWSVWQDDKEAFTGLSHAAAWKHADRLCGEATSRSEYVSGWIFNKEANR